MNGSWLDKNRHLVFIALLLTALVGVGAVYLRQPVQEPIEILPVESPTTAATSTLVPTPTPGMVRVYVTGAVAHTDVYVLPQGSIIKDAIEAADGFSSDADRERINLALELRDQQQIHVPRQGEDNPPPPVQDAPNVPDNDTNLDDNDSASNPGGLININTATLEQLDTLPGIGPAIAQRIVDYRENNGVYKSIEEITQVSGIGEATFAKLKALITVE